MVCQRRIFIVVRVNCCVVILHIAERCLVPPLDPLREVMGMFCGGTPTEAHALQLQEAVKALQNKEHKSSIREIRAFAKPPSLVILTMEAVLVVFEQQPTWTEAKKLLAGLSFLDDVIKFDPIFLSPKALRALKKIVACPDFTPERVGCQSWVCQSLCLWAIAICECGCDIHGIV